jgi:hypothetical protein
VSQDVESPLPVSVVAIHVVESSPVVGPPAPVSVLAEPVLGASVDVSPVSVGKSVVSDVGRSVVSDVGRSVVSDVGKSVVSDVGTSVGSAVLPGSVEPVGSSVMVRMPEVSDVAPGSLEERLEFESELESSLVAPGTVRVSNPPSGRINWVLLSEHPKSPADVNRAPIQTSLASNVLMFPFPERAAAPIDART